MVAVGEGVGLEEGAGEGVVGACAEVLVPLALRPVLRGGVDGGEHLVLLSREPEPGCAPRSRDEPVPGHPHPEGEVVRAADDRGGVLRDHPHAPQVVPEEVLGGCRRGSRAAVDEPVTEDNPVQGRSAGSFIYQRACISRSPSPVGVPDTLAGAVPRKTVVETVPPSSAWAACGPVVTSQGKLSRLQENSKPRTGSEMTFPEAIALLS